MKDANPLERFWIPLRRLWPVVVGGVVLGLIFAWLTLPEPAPEQTAEQEIDPEVTYRATHILLRNNQSPTAVSLELAQLLATQGDLANRVVERLDGRVTGVDVEAVTLEITPELGTLAITALHPDPELATELTTVYAEELNELLQEREDQTVSRSLQLASERAAAADEEIQDLQQDLEELPEDSVDRRVLEAELNILIEQYALAQSEVRTLTNQQLDRTRPFETVQEAAPVSTLVDAPATLELPDDSRVRFALWALLGLLGGLAVVAGIQYVDTRVRLRSDTEEAFGLPVVAEIPRRGVRSRTSSIEASEDPEGATAEAVRALRVAVEISPVWHLAERTPTSAGDSVGSVAPVAQHDPPRSIVITSPLTGDGKTTLVANLAASYAQAGTRVLIVDCDFRRPAIAKLVDALSDGGLRSLTDPYEQPLKDLVVPTSLPGVEIVPAGAPGGAPNWFLGNTEMVVEQALDLADVVLLDTGPILLTNEASALVPWVDALLLVARSGRFNRSQARATVQRLARVGAKVAGVVLVGSSEAARYGYYHPNPLPDVRGDTWPGFGGGEPELRVGHDHAPKR